MAPCLRRLLPWLVVAVASCSSHKGPPLRVVLAHSATSDARCVAPSGTQPQDTALASAQVATLRLTVRRHAATDDAGTFACDRVLQVPHDTPSVEVPASGDGTFDLYGEAFAAPVAGAEPARVAVGALSNVSFTAKTLPDLRLYPAEAFACGSQHMQRPRAFHSATLLPNGQLLIIGGLTTGEDATVDTFAPNPLFVAADAEIYDPATGLFTTMVEAAPPTPRAFHHAALVNTTPPYQILVVGGVTVADTNTPAMGLNTGAGSGTRLIPFDTSGSVFNPLTTAAAGAELVTYDPATHTIKRAPFAGFTPGAFQAGAPLGDGLVVADGIDWMGNPLAATIPAIKQLAVSRALETPRTTVPAIARMGATLTPITDDTALLWGGQITPTDPAGGFVTGLSAGGTVSDTAITEATAPVTQFHTATVAAVDATTMAATLLVTGGFVQTTTNGGQALQPPAATAAPRVLTVTPAGVVTLGAAPTLSGFVADATCADPTRYKPAGWEVATALSRDRVLVSGGAPTAPFSGVSCNDCDGGATLLCGSKQGAIFTAPSSVSPATLAPTAGPLQVPRFGHTATLMHDNNVLVLGGIGSGDGTTHVLWDAEQYNPRPAVTLYDVTSGLPDPDDPIAAELTTSHQSRAPAQPLSSTSQCGTL